MNKIFLLAATAVSLTATPALAQKTKVKTPEGKVKAKNNEVKVKDESGAVKSKEIAPGFSMTENGLQYRILKDAPGDNYPKAGDYVEMHIRTSIGDSSLFSSRAMNQNQPVPFTLTEPAFKGDVVEGFMMLTPGDSAVFRVPVDSLRKAGAQLMPWMESGDFINYEVSLVSVKTEEQVRKETEEQAARQVSVDDSLLQDYFKRNNIKPLKTPSGIFYTVKSKGTGDDGKSGQQITVNYTGRTLDGNVFDSNIDPKFNHVEPFTFMLGQGQVIKGWDEGLTFFKKGSKGTLYIPSRMAYGAQSPSPAIPPHSILIFDVDVLELGTPPVRLEKIKTEKKDQAHDHDHEH